MGFFSDVDFWTISVQYLSYEPAYADAGDVRFDIFGILSTFYCGNCTFYQKCSKKNIVVSWDKLGIHIHA